MDLEQIGLYRQLTPFTNENAGTAEWCKAEKDHTLYFVKKFQSPVYPSRDLGLPDAKYQARVARFHVAEETRKAMYRSLRENDTSGTLVVPLEVINYQYHICTIAEYITANITPEQVCLLSEWQRLVLMRTLTLALMNVHRAGVVHSDMKPQNVLITQNPLNGSCILKLIDFDGSFPAKDAPKHVTGDPAFSAPEIYRAEADPEVRPDQKIDVFALGIVFHYFWTGKMPVTEYGHTIGESVLNNERVILDTSVPPSLRDVILRSLEADPGRRIPAETVYTGLEKLLSDYPVKIVNLINDAKTETPAESRRSRIAGDVSHAESVKRAGIASGKSHESSASVEVLHVDENGKRLYAETLLLEYGKSVFVSFREIPGYHPVSVRKRIEVSVDRYGAVSPSPVRFTYARDKRKVSALAIVLAVLLGFLLLFTGIMYAVTLSAYNNGHYDSAYNFMRFTPFFSTFFPEQHRHLLKTDQELRFNEGNLFVRQAAVIAKPGQVTRFSFTPPADGFYSFTSDAPSNVNTKCSLVRGGTEISSDDGSGGGGQFFLKSYLHKGTTYDWCVSFADRRKTGRFDVILTPDTDMISAGASVAVDIHRDGDRKTFCFYPATSGIYRFYSSGVADPQASIYTSGGEMLYQDDDISRSDKNFQIDAYLNANQKYYFVVWLVNKGPGDFMVHLR